ncbi:MAG: glycosyltransferase family 39 protein, partial [Chloroflexi bacterium]|nr:glycosyltransferase family 39 protein [Chloroflexota bacterium]
MSLFSNQAGVWPVEEPRSEDTQPVIIPAIQVGITLEVLIYVALVFLSLVLRVVQLGHAPLDDAEAQQALAALRTADDRVSGEALVAESPLTFGLNVLSFAVVPASNTAARLPVALAGVLLTLSPVLWRRYLNPLPPLIASFLLAVSPVTLLAARTMSPVVWTMLLAVIAPWLVLRYVETRDSRWAVAATASCAAMIFLTEPAGFLTFLALAFGVIFAWLIDDDPETDLNSAIRKLIHDWPWANGLLAAGIVIALTATGFFWFPSGLTNIGNTLWEGLRGFVVRPDDRPIALPVWIGLRYETALWLFGLVAAYRAVREGGFFERALVGWALAGTLWSLGYAGADSAHALWLTIPVTMLVALAITGWITEKSTGFWNVPAWAVPAHAVLTAALWMIVGVSLIMLGKRLLIDLPYQADDFGALLTTLFKGIYSESQDFAAGTVDQIEIQPGVFVFAYILRQIQSRIMITILVPLLNAVLFFLVGSLWGARSGWRGYALGTLAAGLLLSMGL